MLLFNLQLQQGTVIKRPSATCKTPYVADVQLENNMILAHSAALGCCGLADKDATVFMEKSENSKNVCTQKIMLAKITEKNKNILIGINTKLADNIVHKCLKLDLITCLDTHNAF